MDADFFLGIRALSPTRTVVALRHAVRIDKRPDAALCAVDPSQKTRAFCHDAYWAESVISQQFCARGSVVATRRHRKRDS
ncbi:MAG: hypothetical protein U0326_04640 [Polyangiales bacterium]